MVENTSRTCPYCAEPVRPEAKICPHCRSALETSAPGEAYRNQPGRQLAGVAIALSGAFSVSVTFIRLLFVILTFIHLVGPILYAALWLLLPFERGGRSPLEAFLQNLFGPSGEPTKIDELLAKGRDKARDLFDRMEAWFRGETPPKNGSNENDRDKPEEAR